MRCSTSVPEVDLPESIRPIWRHSKDIPFWFLVDQHPKMSIANSWTLMFDIEGAGATTGPFFTIQSGDPLVMSKDGQVVAVHKRHKVHKTEPSCDGQQPTRMHKNTPLFLHTMISKWHHAFFVHQPQASAMCVELGGPLEKYLTCHQKKGDEPMTLAMWRIKCAHDRHQVTIQQAGLDIGLVMLSMPISDIPVQVARF